ncbi:hypothetical protein HAHE_38360 [Haloferula helveola]|uniref:Uncharacterized protein n=1 Tax=Haloferula helveola TaxID=490095 RepID=A0ABM7RE11_9BACT|nr:hypothetical protein HAHE_38360 [Haloferula helveola]
MRSQKSPSNHISMFTAIGVFGVRPGSSMLSVMARDASGDPEPMHARKPAKPATQQKAGDPEWSRPL